MAKSIYSDHCSRLDILSIPVLIISSWLLKDYIGLLLSCLIFFAMAMVVWISALMTDVYNRALEFIFSMPSLSYRSNKLPCLEIFFSIMITSHMLPNWSYLASCLPPLPIISLMSRTSPIKVSWYSLSRLFSSLSRWCHLRIQWIMSPPREVKFLLSRVQWNACYT